GLTLDTYNGLGFVAAAFVQTRDLRPAFWPLPGARFFLAGYRLFVKFTHGGITRRGLRILRSDADRWPMVLGGNLLTHYNYHKCEASVRSGADSLEITVKSSDSLAGARVRARVRAGA